MNRRPLHSRPPYQRRMMEERAIKEFKKLRPKDADKVGKDIFVIASELVEGHDHMPIFAGSPSPHRKYVWMVTDGKRYRFVGWAKGSDPHWESFYSKQSGHDNNHWIHRDYLRKPKDL